MRKRAIAGNAGRLAYVEHTAEEVSIVDGVVESKRPADVLDRDAWVRAMPAYGWRITDEALLALYDELGPELFGRECLCLWDPDPTVDPSVFGPGMWAACTEPAGQLKPPYVFGYDVSLDHSWASIAVCCEVDGRPHVEVAKHLPGTDWVPGELSRMRSEWKPVAIMGNPSGPGASLLPKIEAAGVDVEGVNGQQYAQACGMLLDDVLQRRLRHLDDPLLAMAAQTAAKRPLNDAWAWSQVRSTTDITPLTSVTLALWGWSQHRPQRALMAAFA